MSDQKDRTDEMNILAQRIGMSLEEFQKTLKSSGEDACDRLGMSVEEFRRITMGNN